MATHEVPPIQTELQWVEGVPEGRDYAPAGYVVIDWTTGLWYRKSTLSFFNTGWQLFSSGGAGGGSLIGIGPPDQPAPDGTIYTDRTTGGQYYYDAIDGFWVQTSV